MSQGLAVGKICVHCQRDVSREKRTRDTHGRYYCNPCWEKMHQPQPQAVGQSVEKGSWIESAWDGTGRWISTLPSRLWLAILIMSAGIGGWIRTLPSRLWRQLKRAKSGAT